MQRYFTKELKDNLFTLSDDDIYHITRVMRMKAGDNIEIVYENCVFISELQINNTAKILEKSGESIRNIKKRVFIIPLLKEQKMDLILQKATELGVDEIIPVSMERSIVKIDESKMEKKLERWAKILKEASEQSKRTDIPTITKVKKIRDLESLEGIKMVCSTQEKQNTLKKFLTTHENYDKINIVIGPEGGISNNEEELLNKIGFESVTLGDRILRVETVPMYVLSVLNYENME